MAGSYSPDSRDGLARKDRAEKIALFRYQLIREAADESITSRQRGPMVRALAAVEHPGPFGGTLAVSKDTIDRWIRAWRRGGFDGLKPKARAQGTRTPVQILSLAATLKLERPARTAAQVRRIMIDTLGDAPSESTLLRHFRTLAIPTGTREVFGRFEADHPNELWVGDGLHGPRIGGRKTYLFAFLDDHSRLVVGRPVGVRRRLCPPLGRAAPGPAVSRHPRNGLCRQRLRVHRRVPGEDVCPTGDPADPFQALPAPRQRQNRAVLQHRDLPVPHRDHHRHRREQDHRHGRQDQHHR